MEREVVIRIRFTVKKAIQIEQSKGLEFLPFPSLFVHLELAMPVLKHLVIQIFGTL